MDVFVLSLCWHNVHVFVLSKVKKDRYLLKERLEGDYKLSGLAAHDCRRPHLTGLMVDYR
jgi:hypothetical protein